jgi:organic radical activating enzyme
MVPIPEYTIYEGQAKELDGITKRIKALTKALRVRGLYDGSVEELSTLLTAADETMIPVQGFVLAEKDGLSRAVQFMPLAEIAGVLVQLYQTREQTKNTIFEIIGISDILRGASKASETATAQNIKAQFGNLRLGSRQREVQRFARDLFRLKAEIMAEKFAPETLEKMTGKPISEEMLAIMQSDSTRGFRVDIETDSTIAIDEAAEQEAITELLTSVVTYMQGIAPLVQQGAFTKEAAVSLLLLAVRRFRGSREVEDTINSLTDKEQGPEAQAGQLEQAKQMIQQLQPLADENQAKAQEAEADRQLKREIETAKMNLEREKLGLKRDESLLVDKRERQKATAVISQKRETEHGNRLVALEGQAQRGFGG